MHHSYCNVYLDDGSLYDNLFISYNCLADIHAQLKTLLHTDKFHICMIVPDDDNMCMREIEADEMHLHQDIYLDVYI